MQFGAGHNPKYSVNKVIYLRFNRGGRRRRPEERVSRFPSAFLRRLLRKFGKWSPFTNYARFGDAQIAACG
jgi:hypothetical protein